MAAPALPFARSRSSCSPAPTRGKGRSEAPPRRATVLRSRERPVPRPQVGQTVGRCQTVRWRRDPLPRRGRRGSSMTRFSVYIVAVAMLVIAVASCGSQVDTTDGSATTNATTAPVPSAHPQAVEPAAGVQAAAAADPSTPAVGDPTAHARSLAEVKREIKELNLCGGVTDVADAQPVTTSSGPGFVADPGTSQNRRPASGPHGATQCTRAGAPRDDLRDQRLPHAGAQRRGRRICRRSTHQGRGRGHRRQQSAAIECRSDQRGPTRAIRPLPSVRPDGQPSSIPRLTTSS